MENSKQIDHDIDLGMAEKEAENIGKVITIAFIVSMLLLAFGIGLAVALIRWLF